MSLITWNDSYSVGIQSIDKQHEQLIHIVNKLFDAMSAGQGATITTQLLVELIQYTKTHFSVEEQYMQKHAYPHYDEHKRLHDNLIQQAGELKAKNDAGQQVTVEVMNFLKNWLIQHIQGADMKYSPFLKEKGVM